MRVAGLSECLFTSGTCLSAYRHLPFGLAGDDERVAAMIDDHIATGGVETTGHYSKSWLGGERKPETLFGQAKDLRVHIGPCFHPVTISALLGMATSSYSTIIV